MAIRKNTDQVGKHSDDPANIEFGRLAEVAKIALGWNSLKISTMIHKTSGAVSQYLNGRTRPAVATLELFRMRIFESVRARSVAENLSAAAEAAVTTNNHVLKDSHDEEISKLVQMLTDMRTEDHEGFGMAKSVITTYHKRRSKK